MRYQNWDILLFEENSRIPIQEFKTGCHLLQDPESPILRPYSPSLPLPTLTSFLPSLAAGAPFRISIHSWTPPEPSASLLAHHTNPSLILYEARVLLDGHCIALTLFSANGPFPHIIDWSTPSLPDPHPTSISPVATASPTISTPAYATSSPHPNPLRFPPFYDEILAQNWWSAGESLGRIKVVIAEGVRSVVSEHASLLGSPHPRSFPPFDRWRNLLVASWQHAPIEVLEACGIAYPNPQMWGPLCTSPRRTIIVGDADDHAHSPTRSPADSSAVVSTMTTPKSQIRDHSTLPPLVPSRMRGFDGGFAQHSPQMGCDGGAFADGSHERFYSVRHGGLHSTGRKTSAQYSSADDQPMPDYSNSATTASSRSVTGGLVVKPTRAKVQQKEGGRERAEEEEEEEEDEGIFEELCEAFAATPSPRKAAEREKRRGSGCFPPANTRTSSDDRTPVERKPGLGGRGLALKTGFHTRGTSYSEMVEQRRKPSVAHERETIGKLARRHERLSSDASMLSASVVEDRNGKENVEPTKTSEDGGVVLRTPPARSIRGKKQHGSQCGRETTLGETEKWNDESLVEEPRRGIGEKREATLSKRKRSARDMSGVSLHVTGHRTGNTETELSKEGQAAGEKEGKEEVQGSPCRKISRGAADAVGAMDVHVDLDNKKVGNQIVGKPVREFSRASID